MTNLKHFKIINKKLIKLEKNKQYEEGLVLSEQCYQELITVCSTNINNNTLLILLAKAMYSYSFFLYYNNKLLESKKYALLCLNLSKKHVNKTQIKVITNENFKWFHLLCDTYNLLYYIFDGLNQSKPKLKFLNRGYKILNQANIKISKKLFQKHILPLKIDYAKCCRYEATKIQKYQQAITFAFETYDLESDILKKKYKPRKQHRLYFLNHYIALNSWGIANTTLDYTKALQFAKISLENILILVKKYPKYEIYSKNLNTAKDLIHHINSCAKRHTNNEF